MVCVDNLSKQKVTSALDLFTRELTTGLEDEHGKAARVTWSFLRKMNDYMV